MTKPSGGGWLYILSNAAMPGLLKVGYTQRAPKVRAVEIGDATGVPCAFRLLHAERVTGNPEAAEGRVHRFLSRYRPSQNREFFFCGVDEAKAAIAGVVAGKKPPSGDPAPFEGQLPDGWRAPTAPAKRLASTRAGQLQGREFGNVGSIDDMLAFASGGGR